MQAILEYRDRLIVRALHTAWQVTLVVLITTDGAWDKQLLAAAFGAGLSAVKTFLVQEFSSVRAAAAGQDEANGSEHEAPADDDGPAIDE